MAHRNPQQQPKQQQKPAQEHLAKQVGSGHGNNYNTTQENNTMTTNTTTEVRMIPLSQLARSPLNVRKSGSGDVSELMASIKANGVIQNLVVTPEKKGKRSVMGVVAGGRRLDALAQLVKSGELDPETLVPCREVSKAEAVEVSTAENVVREAMHPADEFEAYAAMLDAKKPIDQVAARFGVTVRHVEQRMKMAKLSPKVIEAYRTGKLRLDAVMAYTLTDDHKRQNALLKQGVTMDFAIRRALTETVVGSDDRRARFVGEKAYVAAGGTVRQDLFADRCYFENVELLDKLVSDKLESKAAKLRKEFAWVEIEVENDWNTRARYCDIPTVRGEPSPEVAEQLAKLQAKVDELDKACEADEEDEALWDRCMEAHEELAGLENSLQVPHPDAAELAGAVVMLDYSGRLEVLRNVVRKADRAKLRKDGASESEGDQGAITKAEADPNAVRIDLTTYATAVAQQELAKNVPVALRLLAFQLTYSLLRFGYDSVIEVQATKRDGLDANSETLQGSPVATALAAMTEKWATALPQDSGELMAWCLAADDAQIGELLAYVTAASINGVQNYAGSRDLAPYLKALDVQMVNHWTPNAGYFARIRKAETLRILAEHGHTGPELAKMKRDALAERAAELLQGTGWLPPSLR